MNGLYGKYNITKSATGEPINGFAFVLKPDTDPAAHAALTTYAEAVKDSNPKLWSDLMYHLGFRHKVTNEEQAQLDADNGVTTVRVLRLHMDGYGDLILNSLDDLNDDLQWTFLGEENSWREFKDGEKITITIESMSKDEFDILEPWEA